MTNLPLKQAPFIAVTLGVLLLTQLIGAGGLFMSPNLATPVALDMWDIYTYGSGNGIDQDLVVRDKGEDVRLVQRAMNAFVPSFTQDNVTGYFGPKTLEAVSAYQAANGLAVTGKVDAPTRQKVNDAYLSELCPRVSGDGLFDDTLLQVNKDKPLASGYVPHNLTPTTSAVKTIGIECVREDVLAQLENMFTDAKRDGNILAVTSGFRRAEIQNIVYHIWTSVMGEQVKMEVAEPSHSEHQLGTAVDISGESNSFASADPAFGKTPEYFWLLRHAHKYGFVMSYPEEMMDVTGYVFEPWHYRYVGVDVATKIYKQRTTLEEYLDSRAKQDKKSKKKKS